MLSVDLSSVLFMTAAVSALYFVVWNSSQLLLGVVSAQLIRSYLRRRTDRNRAHADRVPAPLQVSVIVPAYNEALTIVDNVRALLALEYESREIVVVNDGSSDNTFQVLREAFQLLVAPVAYVTPLKSESVRGVYRSTREPALVVIDKANGGSKADALNAGINVASGSLVLTIDADTVIEPDGLTRAVLPFLEDPSTVAVGGNVGVVNGCHLEGGRIVTVSLPDSWLARFQIVEYMRSFLMFRVACGSLNAITLISGAFGLFRRDAVIAVGGYHRSAIGEDIDLTLRLQQHFRIRRQPFRIVFDPIPLCSTQVPEDRASLRAQRYRWRRGLLQSLWRNRRMIGNPRYGIVGLGALPYVMVFEGLGPLIEMSGYFLVGVAVLAGLLDWRYYAALMLVAVTFGVAATLGSVLLNDMATRRYMSGRDLLLLVGVAIVENFGYRQLNSWWACVGTVQTLRQQHGWGVIKRRVFEGDEPSARTRERPT